MSTGYSPSNVPQDFTPQQRDWLRREFSAIKHAWERDKESERFTALHVAPEKTSSGDVVFADGTDWNPGRGAGLYLRSEANDSFGFVGPAVTSTFTPAIVGATTAGVGTYSTQQGFYTRVGDFCLFSVHLAWSAHTGTGNMEISGLPFTSASGVAAHSISAYQSNITLPGGHVLQPYVAAGTALIRLHSYAPGGGATGVVSIDTSGALYLGGIFKI